MRTILMCFALLLAAHIALAQNESDKLKKVADLFKENYNGNAYEAIFTMFNPQMKQAVPQDALSNFLTGLNSQAGKMEQLEFVRYSNGTVALYKTTFERGLFGINLSIDSESQINGLQVVPFNDEEFPILERNTTPLILPFKEEWSVFWGGDTEAQNYHVTTESQKGAFDLVIRDENGRSYKTDGRTNEDYYVFGKDIIAPADGEVVLVVDGVKDNVPGQMNSIYVPGNTVIIKTANDEYLFFAHFKQQSIVVKQGQKVKQGELLGLCGNSGNSSEPHLHFHIQNVENMVNATGAKSFFAEIMVNGELKKDYSPVRGEKIKNK
ncbi:M23 family metallopeptidase [Roseivirga sp. E12]|uniref:M23 family metallopeptidase n=1 Tax=Roseivirga sp. E12 TaxID=2819237 RepID=UPI001ABCB510|nr:M23 family metallopeptidase [Roseivirga sp. E12]MBO3696820.1 peptidoglycan DD-metalloendopeptidase family protein [Roseivirga sp. E12]